MEPRWEIIRAAVTFVVCIVLLSFAYIVWRESNEEIVAFLATMRDMGRPNRTMEEKTWGLASFGLVIISLLTVLKILTRFGQ